MNKGLDRLTHPCTGTLRSQAILTYRTWTHFSHGTVGFTSCLLPLFSFCVYVLVIGAGLLR